MERHKIWAHIHKQSLDPIVLDLRDEDKREIWFDDYEDNDDDDGGEGEESKFKIKDANFEWLDDINKNICASLCSDKLLFFSLRFHSESRV